MKFFINIIIIFVVFSSIFANDFKIDNFYVFYLAYLSAILLRLFLGIKYTVSEFFSQVIIFSFTFIAFATEIHDNGYYSPAILMPLLFVNILPLFIYLLSGVFHGRKEFVFLFFAIAFSSVLVFVATGSRIELLFGRNVLYRIFTFIYAFVLLYQLIYVPKKFYVLLTYLFFGFSIFSLGSRGGLIVWLSFLPVILSLFYNFKFSLKSIFYSSAFSFFVILILYFSSFYFRRVFYFDVDNASEQVRLFYYFSLYNLFTSFDFYELFFGIGSPLYFRLYDGYPHNAFLEYIVLYGFLFSFPVIVIYIKTLFSFNDFRYLPFFGILIGSFVSGDLYYNFTIISLLYFWIFDVYEKDSFNWRLPR